MKSILIMAAGTGGVERCASPCYAPDAREQEADRAKATSSANLD